MSSPKLISKMLIIAVDNAMQSSHPRYKFAAVIFRRNRVLAIGKNIDCTHPKSNHMSQKIHAEMSSIFIAKSKRINITGADIAVARLTIGMSKLSSAKPCICCYELIKNARLRNIYYTTYTNQYGIMKV